MMFQKPKNQKFTDMAIYFDHNFWLPTKEEDCNIYFKYIYHILYMLASKSRYFSSFDEYDEFASLSATTLYIRFSNKKKKVYQDVDSIIDGTYFSSFNSSKVRSNMKKAFEKKDNNQPNMFDLFNITPSISILDLETYCNKLVDEYKTHQITYFELTMIFNNSGILTETFVKSLLNYCKNCLYPLKITYQNDTFKKIYNIEYDSLEEINGMESYQKTQIQRDYAMEVLFNFTEQFKNVVVIAKNLIDKSPFKEKTCLRKRVYTSLLLSFINSITLTNQDYQKLIDRMNKHLDITPQLVKAFKKESNAKPILWRLDDMYSDYIKYLLRLLKEELVKEFKDTHNSLELTDDVLNDIMNTVHSSAGAYSNEITN